MRFLLRTTAQIAHVHPSVDRESAGPGLWAWELGGLGAWGLLPLLIGTGPLGGRRRHCRKSKQKVSRDRACLPCVGNLRLGSDGGGDDGVAGAWRDGAAAACGYEGTG
jgi:hypothetical protein